jgi:hypothetical protein
MWRVTMKETRRRRAVATAFATPEVANTFASYPVPVQRKLTKLRSLIFDVACTSGVGAIEETLKWGEPAYLTTQSRSGSTIRLGWKRAKPSQYAMYFNCQTDLVETFRALFANTLVFEGNRAIVFDERDELPLDALRVCIEAALTYHARKRSR